MRLAVVLALILVSALFAGCLGSDEEPETGTNGTPEDNGEPETGTSEQGEGEHGSVRPEARLTANVSQGDVPLNLTLTLDAEHPTPGNLTWVLTTALAQGNETATQETLEEGTGLPVQRNHTLEQAGNHTFTLTVADGEEQSQVNLTINVLEGGPTGPIVTIQEGNTGSSQGTPFATLSSGNDWQFPVEPTDATTGYIVEVTWDATEIYNENLDLWIRHEDGGASIPPEDPTDLPPGGPIVTDKGGSPLRIEVPIELLEDPGVYEIMVRAHSDPVGYANNQPFVIHIATFEGIPFDEDFTMLE